MLQTHNIFINIIIGIILAFKTTRIGAILSKLAIKGLV